MERFDDVSRSEASSAYDGVWELTRQMLEAARKDDWDGLVALEKNRLQMVLALKVLEIATVLDQEHVAKVIQQILEADEKIKILAASWMVELQGQLASVGNERKLSQTYNQP